MKETESKFKEEVKLHAEKQQEKQTKFIGTIQPHQGHTCYELDMNTGIIDKAVFEIVAVEFTDPKYNKEVVSKLPETTRKKLVVKENHLYTTALNKKNALKHFRKMISVDKIQK